MHLALQLAIALVAIEALVQEVTSVGGFFLVIGLLLILFGFGQINTHPHQPNSPFLWLFLFAGVVLTGFGLIVMILSLE